MINLNALLRRPVEYYEYPWALESALCGTQAMVRSLFQPPDEVDAAQRPPFLERMPDALFRIEAALLRFLPAGLPPPDPLRQAP